MDRRPRMPAPTPWRRAGLAIFVGVALAAALSACSRTTEVGPAAATPADMAGISVLLKDHGIKINGPVSGDAGCTDPDLVAPAISFTASGLDQATPVPVHLYIFASDASYQKLRPAVDTCAQAYVTDFASLEAVDASPYVAMGQGPWGASFKAAFRDSLQQAAGASG
jgi:hypothetical protein